MRLGIAVPTYNEAGNLELLVPAIRRELAALSDVECLVLVVDDASPDGTGAIAEVLAATETGPGFAVEVLHRPHKDGLARAYIDGFARLVERGCDHVMEMDADLSHDPAHLPAFLAAAATSELVVGSRYVTGGGTPDWSPLRRLLSRGGNRYIRLAVGSALRDWTGGFNLYSVGLLKKAEPGLMVSRGYSFQIELKHNALRHCDRVAEVPITFVDRARGQSKIPRSTIADVLLLGLRIRLRGRSASRAPVSSPPGPGRRRRGRLRL